MDLIVLVFVILATWKWGKWKYWQNYHSTMLFITMGNMLYIISYSNHYLWRIEPTLFPNFVSVEPLYTFIILPLTVLIFLSEYPITIKDKILYNAKYIIIFFLIEAVFYVFGKILYSNGWNIWWSLGWDCMMFPMLALHHKKPLKAYMASIIVLIVMLILFPINIR